MKRQYRPNSIEKWAFLSMHIDKIKQVHNRNLAHQKQTQQAHESIMVEHEKRKLSYHMKVKQKESQMMSKLIKDKAKRIQLMKYKDEHMQKIICRLHKNEEQKIRDKLEMIEKRKFNSQQNWNSKKQQSPTQHKTQKVRVKNISHSLNLETFYDANLTKTSQMSKQILEKSLQKQKRAQENRKSLLQEHRKMKLAHQQKNEKRFKLFQEMSLRESFVIKKSILKLQQAERKIEENQSSQRKKSIQKKQQAAKNAQKVKQKREMLENDLMQKFENLQKIRQEKASKVDQNKQNYYRQTVNNMKKLRSKQTEHNQLNYQNNKSRLNEKYEQSYKKDREHWGFLTSVIRRKDGLIEKNIFENHQLSRNK